MVPKSYLLLVIFLPAFLAAQPVINSFSPASGAIGSTVTITGTNFSSAAASNIVYFGGVRATVNTANATSLSVTVPVGTTYQPISVTVNNLTAYSLKPFNVLIGAGEDLSPNSFNFKLDFQMPNPGGSTRVRLEDIDGDGKNDMVSTGGVQNNQLSVVSVHRNTGSPTAVFSFASRLDFVSDTMANDLFVADLDGDGKKDIMVTHTVERKLAIFRNTSTTGNISFATRIDINLPYSGTCIIASDFDYDGKPDIAIGYDVTTPGGTKSAAIFRNTSTAGNISFAAPIDLTTGSTSSLGISSGDIDGDGKVDLLMSSYLPKDFSVFRNLSTPGNISFASRVDFGSQAEGENLAIADLDGDGKLDVLASPGNALQVYRNTSSTGSFSFDSPYTVAVYPGVWMQGVTDFDGDGKPDIAVAIGIGGPMGNGIFVIRNLCTPGNISFGPSTFYTTNFSTNSSVALGDMDGDQLPDIAISNFGPGIVTTLRNRIYSPRITSFNPTSACYGKQVAINGVNFTGINSVLFGGIPALSFNVVSPTLINAIVGNGATGNIIISKPAGGFNGITGTSGFTFTSSSSITSFLPTTATTGNTVTITGTNFSNVSGVAFGGVLATSFNLVSPTTITAVVGAGASGDISMLVNGCIVTISGFTFGTVTAVGGPSGTNSPELRVSPNPARGILYIDHPSSIITSHLKLLDMTGREVKQKTIAGNQTQSAINISGVPAGIYKLIWTDDKKIYRRKVMIGN